MALLSAVAQAAQLQATARLSVPGAPQVAALLALPSGERVLCSGSRWLVLNAQGRLTKAVSTSAPCLGLSISPAGTRLVTSTANGLAVWNVADGRQVRGLDQAETAGKVGFQDETTLLYGSAKGLVRLDLPSGQQVIVRQAAINALFTAPDGQRAVVSDGQKVQLLKLPTLEVLSGYRCETLCAVQNVNFSADGRTAVAFAAGALIGLRDGVPASTVGRNLENASGLPQPDNTVLTFEGGAVASHDLQTGRREKVIVASGIQSGPVWSNGEQVLALSATGELLSTDREFRDVQRLPLPGAVTAGGLDAQGGIYALSGGNLWLGQKRLNGVFWTVQTVNKTTWALLSDGAGGLQTALLNGEKLTRLPGSRTATHLSINHWGNHAALWDDETLSVVSQPQGKVVQTFKLPLKEAQVTLSPDATRAYVFPGEARKGDPYVLTLATGKRTPLPAALQPAGGWLYNAQISGNGTFALLGSRENLTLRFPDPKRNGGATEARGNVVMRFSPDSRWLAYSTIGADGPVVVLQNVETGNIESTSAPLSDQPSFLAWSADSKQLAVEASLLSELASVTVFAVR